MLKYHESGGISEGLPLMIAIVLQSNAGKMLDSNVLVRKAIGIETAGSLNVIFSDKTGTITKGVLEVVEFFTADGTKFELDKLSSQANKVKGLLDICIGKNTAAMVDDKHRVIGGNSTDQALLRFLGEDTYFTLYENKDCQVIASQGFNSANKFSQAQVKDLKGSKTFYKGAPERLLAKAKKCLDKNGNIINIDMDTINKNIDDLAGRAMRVLAFGYSEKPLEQDKINDDLVIIGFVGIRDDVRPEAKTAIKEVKQAGIQVVMITGDRLETAVAIGKEANLLEGNIDVINAETVKAKDFTEESLVKAVEKMDTVALSSDALQSLSDDTMKEILPKLRVIARALPTDKSRMVKICQEMNIVAGMCGDGVNDSPALKRADVGFAMGSGTEAAKEASEIVILDDNFQSIRNAVLYGRTIYHNILKFCKFQLSINVGAVLTSAVLPFFGVEEPLNVMQLLFVNLCMDTLGSLLLGQEPADVKYMSEPPRKRDENIVSKKMFMQFVITGLYLFAVSIFWFKSGVVNFAFANEAQLKTGFFAAFMFVAILNGFNVRTESINVLHNIKGNPNFFKVLGAMLAATFVLCEMSLLSPAVGKVFGCTAFGLTGWAIVLLVAITVYPIDVIRKLITGEYK